MPALVSILIPCHNAAPWLAETLRSALGQTWGEKEVILVDDGSTDQSLEIARSFESKGVHVVSQENGGASAARNRALSLARGEYFQFLDADDLLSPDKIAAQLATAESRSARAVISCAWGRFTTDPRQAQFVDTAVFRDFAPLEFLIQTGMHGTMMHPAAWLVPRAVAEKAGRWDETLSLNDDGEYFARVVLASDEIRHCPIARSLYRSRLPGSLSQVRSDRARRSQFRSIELIAGHMLAAEDSARTRAAIAASYRRFIHDFFPSPAELMHEASRRVTELGELIGPPAMGPKTALLSRVFGWRNVWRMKHALSR
jgi:glycosyltransferase involved in cell wall biosynthesis